MWRRHGAFSSVGFFFYDGSAQTCQSDREVSMSSKLLRLRRALTGFFGGGGRGWCVCMRVRVHTAVRTCVCESAAEPSHRDT